MNGNNSLAASAPFTGTIQIAKNPAGAAGEAIFDAGAGAYPTQANITGVVSGQAGSYTLAWTKAGVNKNPLIMFALPHMVQSFEPTTNGLKTAIQLQSTTKGLATAVVADSWTMIEPNLPVDMGFAPWSPTARSVSTLSATAISAINSVATAEVSQNMIAQTNLDSMYFSGKGLGKFAAIVYTINDLAKNTALAQTGLANLKTAYATFVNNKQIYPLVYESTSGPKHSRFLG